MERVVQITNVAGQLIWLLYIVNKCMDKNNRKSKNELILMYLLDMIVYISLIFLTYDITKTIVINHIICIFIMLIIYSKDKYNILIVFSMLHIFMSTILNITNSIFIYYIRNINIVFIIILQFIISFFIIKNSYIIINLYKKLYDYKYSWMIIILSFFFDYILKYYRNFCEINITIIIDMAIIGYIVFFSLGLVYFMNIKLKANTIFELHRNLDDKNNQLRNIKKNHEKQIMYLDYLSKSNNFDEVGEYLKEIINDGQTDINSLKRKHYESSILNLIEKHISNPEINLIIEEKYNLSNVLMPEMELYRIMINIVDNAVKAMNGKGIIKINVYKKDNVVLSIENDGPPIKEQDLKHIFEEGFTTKSNQDKSHGFGLSIVKDLVEKYGGQIQVESCDKYTKFIIFLK